MSKHFHRMWGRVNKVFSILVYFFVRRFITLDPVRFDGKRIILIGPARTVVEELEEVNLNDFDLVVRMNRAIDLPLNVGDLGWRIDFLFHNMKEHGVRSAGKVDHLKVSRAGIKYLVFPGNARAHIFPVLAKFFLFRRKTRVGTIPLSLYTNLRSSVEGYSPTTGAVAISYFLRANFSSLHIVGFTFFKTKYVDGYNDCLASDRQAVDWARERNIHRPDIEASYIRLEFDRQVELGKKISLGKHVLHSLCEEEV